MKTIIYCFLIVLTLQSTACFADDSSINIEQQLADIKAAGWDTSDDPEKKAVYDGITAAMDVKQKIGGDLQNNAADMKAKEQSDANKLLGGAAIGAGGIGMSQVAQGMSEQSADKDAERAMSSYLATFMCRGSGIKSVRGGALGQPVGDGGSLDLLREQYLKLAAQLKADKEALGLPPGIESEVILDKEYAQSRLYQADSLRTGGNDGADGFSLAKALADKKEGVTSAETMAMDAQKEETNTRLKTGKIAAGIGILGGAVGNILVNDSKFSSEVNKKKENSKEILANGEKSQKELDSWQKKLQDISDKDIASCNAIIRKNKELVEKIKSGDKRLIGQFQSYIDDIEPLEPLSGTGDLKKINDIAVCMCEKK